jgi:hypothetical protein
MTIERAIEILTPDRRPDYSPAEYDEALELARLALRFANPFIYGFMTPKEATTDDT